MSAGYRLKEPQLDVDQACGRPAVRAAVSRGPRRRLRLGFTALAMCVLPMTLSAQSLGSAAEKEKERRRTTARAKGGGSRVITDEQLAANKGRLANDPDNVGMEPGEPPSASPPAATPASASKPGGSAGVDDSARRSEWRMRVLRARQRISEAEQALAKARADVARVLRRNPQWVEGLTRALEARAQAETELARARQAVDELEEEARRAGVPPGWLRE
jgi:hypothetical protein